MAERTGTYFYCSTGHGPVVFEIMRGAKRDYGRCPVVACGQLLTWPRGLFPGLTREAAWAAAQPVSEDEKTERLRGVTVVLVPTGDELQRISEEADQIPEEIEAEEQADLDAVDGGAWPPSVPEESA